MPDGDTTTKSRKAASAAALLVALAAMVLAPLYAYVLRLGISVFDGPMLPLISIILSIVISLLLVRRTEAGSRTLAFMGYSTCIAIAFGLVLIVTSYAVGAI